MRKNKPNKNYICRSLEPKSIEKLWKTLVKLENENNNYLGSKVFYLKDWLCHCLLHGKSIPIS